MSTRTTAESEAQSGGWFVCTARGGAVYSGSEGGARRPVHDQRGDNLQNDDTLHSVDSGGRVSSVSSASVGQLQRSAE